MLVLNSLEIQTSCISKKQASELPEEMEIVSFAKEVIQSAAEQAASYRLGQIALRHLDRALWVVEKCARWAVPPPLDQDDSPQPELIRPLPWVFFLALLLVLRVTREFISLFIMMLGKQPLRSIDVVTFIQSKRRYFRTLKYQGNRIMRARRCSSEPWYSSLQRLFEFTMCFRPPHNYGNNNTTSISNNDELLVVKRRKRTREPAAAAASANEATMERLIEKMMVDLDAESDDDSSFTLTNATSVRSDDSESDQNTIQNHDDTLTSIKPIDTSTDSSNENEVAPMKSDNASSTPEKDSEEKRKELKTHVKDKGDLSYSEFQNEMNSEYKPKDVPKCEDVALKHAKQKGVSPKQETTNFIQNERSSAKKSTPSPKKKIANGRSNSSPNKMKAATEMERIDTPRRASRDNIST